MSEARRTPSLLYPSPQGCHEGVICVFPTRTSNARPLHERGRFYEDVFVSSLTRIYYSPQKENITMFQTSITARNITRNHIELTHPTLAECFSATIQMVPCWQQCLSPIPGEYGKIACGHCSICRLILEARDRYGINHNIDCHCNECYPPHAITEQPTQLLAQELEDHLPWCHCDQCLAEDTLPWLPIVIVQDETICPFCSNPYPNACTCPF